MTDHRKKPGVAFWATAVLVVGLVAAYPLSIGPVAWLTDRDILPEITDTPIRAFYTPLYWIVGKSESARAFHDWYLGLWVDLSDEPPPASAK